jgi:hypothetical protein
MDWTAGKRAARWRRVRRCRLDGILERRSQESILTACGQRVGLMTRAAANAIDSDAAHSPPPFPTVLALDPILLAEFLFWIGFMK